MNAQQFLSPDPLFYELTGTAVGVGAEYVVSASPYSGKNVSSGGIAYLFDLSGNPLRSLSSSDLQSYDNFGQAVLVEGTSAWVGAPGADPAGAVYRFDLATGNQSEKLAPAGLPEEARFGSSLAVNASWLVVGAPEYATGGAATGAVYVFHASDRSLAYVFSPAELSDADKFGTSVSINGNLLAVGSPGDDALGENRGAIYVFDLVSGNQLQKLVDGNLSNSAALGTSAAIANGRVIGGAPLHQHAGQVSGRACLFDLQTGTLIHRFAPSESGANQFGRQVALHPSFAIIADPGHDASGDNQGAISVFRLNDFTPVDLWAPPGVDDYDAFGSSIARYDQHLVAGSPYRDADSNNSGAAYLLDLSGYEQETVFTVTFDPGAYGVLLQGDAIQDVPEGEDAAPPLIDADPGWLFTGWIGDYTAVTEDRSILASYTVDPDSDSDGDGIPDVLDDDRDGDGLLDDWEILHYGSLDTQPGDDSDNDGLTQLEEFQLGTDPRSSDTDRDGYPDGFEHGFPSDPNDANSLPLRPLILQGPTLNFHGKAGLVFQVFSSDDLIRWSPVTARMPGEDAMITVEIDLPDSGLAAFFQVVVENPTAKTWSALQIKAAAELDDPLGGGEGEQHPLSFERSVSHPQILYAGIDVGGVWVSRDNGVSWTKTEDRGALARGYPGLGIAPSDPDTIYSFTEVTSGDGAEMRDALEVYEGIYKSDDGGQNWSLVVAIPNPFTIDFRNYRIWRQLFTARKQGTVTIWYAAMDQSGIWRIDDPNDGSAPIATQLVPTPDTRVFYWLARIEHSGTAYLLYGNEHGLFSREILAEGLGEARDLSVPVNGVSSGEEYLGGITHFYVNPTNPNEIWAARRWDRVYRTLNGFDPNPVWTAIELLDPNGQIDPALTWPSLGAATGSMVMGVTPFAGNGHTITVNDGTLRSVPARGFLSTRNHIAHLVWQGATPYWQLYDRNDNFNADFKKRPVLSSYRKAPFGSHAGYRFHPGDPDNVAAYGLSTFWHTASGGIPDPNEATWRHVGYGQTGYAVQIGIGGIVFRDGNPDEQWFPWNDVGIGRTLNGGISFEPRPFIDATRNETRPDQFYWRTSANLHLHPANATQAVAFLGYPAGRNFKPAKTDDGGASWTVASEDPDHIFANGEIAGGGYVRLRDAQDDWQARAYLGRIYSTTADNSAWAFLDTFNDRRGGVFEAPLSGRKHAMLAVTAGDGKLSPDAPTAYASRTDGYSDLIRGEPNPNKASGFQWWTVMADAEHSFKHTAGYPLAAVSPASRDVVFTAMRTANPDDAAGTEFGQILARYDFSGASDASNPSVVTSDPFLPRQPGATAYNIVNDLVAHPEDDRVVFAVSAAAGLPFVFKATFLDDNETVLIEDLTGDAPRIGGSSISYDPRDGGRLLISNLSGTWIREL